MTAHLKPAYLVTLWAAATLMFAILTACSSFDQFDDQQTAGIGVTAQQADNTHHPFEPSGAPEAAPAPGIEVPAQLENIKPPPETEPNAVSELTPSLSRAVPVDLEYIKPLPLEPGPDGFPYSHVGAGSDCHSAE